MRLKPLYLTRLLLLLTLVPVAATAAMPPAANTGTAESRKAGRWYDDFEQAVQESRRLNVPLLIHFYANWCQPCRRMERDVLNDPRLLAWIGRELVAVRVNVERHAALVERFGIQALPSDVVVGADGTVLSRTGGYQPKQAYLARLSALCQSARQNAGRANHRAERNGDADSQRPWRRVRAVPTVESKQGEEAEEESSASDSEAGTNRADVQVNPIPACRSRPSPPLGLEGYCPVRLWERREWRKGRREFSAIYKGTEYRLSSRDAYQKFAQNPSKYAPRLLGCDPVVLWTTDRAVPGSVRYAAYFEGELFLFVSDETRHRFRDDPERYARLRHVLRIKDIGQTITR